MPRYKVRVKYVEQPHYATVIIDSGEDIPDFVDMRDRVDDLFQEDPDAFEWEPVDDGTPPLRDPHSQTCEDWKASRD